MLGGLAREKLFRRLLHESLLNLDTLFLTGCYALIVCCKSASVLSLFLFPFQRESVTIIIFLLAFQGERSPYLVLSCGQGQGLGGVSQGGVSQGVGGEGRCVPQVLEGAPSS